jgi:hypothetical protein
MKRTLLAFGLAPLIPATIYGVAGAANVLLHPASFGGTAPVLGGFLVPFFFGAVVACVIAWTLGVLAFLVFRALKIEGWISYSLAGLFLGATYAFLTKQERAGGDLAFYFSAFCFFGVSASAGFWAIRRREPIQPPQTTTGSSAPDRV